jgi:hypothetical protein
MQKISKTEICLICSPNLGILDNWVPIIKRLKYLDPTISITYLIPDSSTLSSINDNNILINISETLVDKVIYRAYSGLWVRCRSLKDASRMSYHSSFFVFLHQVSKRLLSKKLSYFLVFTLLSKLINAGLILADKLKYLWQYSANIISVGSIFKNIKTVLYDVYIEKKESTRELTESLKSVLKFSITHGALYIKKEDFIYDSAIANSKNRDDVVAYLTSELEVEYFSQYYGIKVDNLKVVGITKHDKRWMNFLVDYYKEKCEIKIPFSDYILIISRPTSSYLPLTRKKQALKNIKILADKLELNIIIKLHPKENDKNIFYDIFNQHEYGSKWVILDYHPFILGKKCKFAVSFFSSVVLDVLAVGAPVIEYLNIQNIELYDNQKSLRDSHNNPIFYYKYFDLVLGAQSLSELEENANEIMNNPKTSLEKLLVEYERVFSDNTNIVDNIAQDIISRQKIIK